MPKQWLNEEALDVLVNYYYPKAGWLQDNVNWGKLDYEGPEANEIINDPLLQKIDCLLYTSPSPRDRQKSRMPSSA